MSNWIRNLVPAAALSLVVACGGGGDGGNKGGDAPRADKDFPTASASASFAQTSVGEVNGLVEEINQVDIGGNVILPSGALLAGPPTGTTSSGSLNCSSMGTSGGSGTAEYTFTSQGNKPVSGTVTYKQCSFTSSGITMTMNGKYTYKYGNYVDSTHFSVVYSYDMTYTYTGPTFDYSGKLKTSQSCTLNGTNYKCNYQVNDGYVLDDYDVSSSGTTVTVHSAAITTANATITFTDWVYDTATGHATSGSVEVQYTNGDSVSITATGAGYTVVVTIGGNAFTYSIGFGS